MRLFVAVPLPAAYQEQLRRLAGDAGARLASRVSWTRPGTWHATLKFLGEVEPVRAAEVRRALGGVRFTPFALRAGGCGFFPNERRPRVAWVGLGRGGDELARLAARVERALAPQGFAPEGRPFAPHLTLFRVRRDAGDDWYGLCRQVAAMDWPEIPVESFALYQSELGPEGPSHTALETFGSRGLPPEGGETT